MLRYSIGSASGSPELRLNLAVEADSEETGLAPVIPAQAIRSIVYFA